MATIAVLGMGLLGRGFAENLLGKGHRVQVWNRTAAKCAPVVEQGAVQAESPADAVRGAERVHLILAADAAVDAVIAQLRAGLGDGVPIVDHSTNLPAGVASRAARLAAEGVRYLHAPVFMGPVNSRDATGLMLVSGPAADRDALRDALTSMTGRLVDLGDRPDKAAAIKIIGNGMLVVLTAGMGDLFRVGQGAGVTPEEIIQLFKQFSPTPAGMGSRVLTSHTHAPTFELSMARKDMGLMIETAGGDDALTVLPAVARVVDALIAEGHGAEDFTFFARPGRSR